MAAKQTLTRYAPVLAKIAETSESWMVRGALLPQPHTKFPAGLAEELTGHGLLGPHPDRHGNILLVITDRGREIAEKSSATILCRPGNSGAKRAQAALWTWLLHHGGQASYYGGWDYWGSHGEVAHVLACGVDLDKSSAVSDDTWSTFAGTFADSDDTEHGVGGLVSCRCGEVQRATVQAKVESVTDLLAQVLTIS